jgi:hypothetical protein
MPLYYKAKSYGFGSGRSVLTVLCLAHQYLSISILWHQRSRTNIRRKSQDQPRDPSRHIYVPYLGRQDGAHHLTQNPPELFLRMQPDLQRELPSLPRARTPCQRYVCASGTKG